MKKPNLIEMMLLGGLMLFAGCATQPPPRQASDMPPPPPAEMISPQPNFDYVWNPGYWDWDGSWVWVKGYWGPRPHPGAVWVQGGWVYHGDKRVWVHSHWR